jgi:adenylate kinase
MTASYIVLLGPPGAGKGTQAQLISAQLGLPHISSGNLFRENMKSSTELGNLARMFIDRGELVPDKVTMELIRERLLQPDCVKGALMDGFPRTKTQAKAFDSLLHELDGEVKAVPYISLDESIVVERMAGRWTCRQSGHVFHEKFNPPKQPGLCDQDGSELYQREDDIADTVVHRFRVYLEKTAPLIEYYRQQNKLFEVDGSLEMNQVAEEILNGLRARV